MSELQPSCENCDFFNHGRNNDLRLCRKHDFVMPRVGWQMLCKDWCHNEQSVDFGDMDPETLYYYSLGSGKPRSALLARMEALQRLVLSVNIRQDKEMGWVIVPRTHQELFPPPGSLLTVVISGRRSKFQIANVERNLAVEMIPLQRGRWDKQIHTQQVVMLQSMESPQLLQDWLNSFIDLEALSKHSFTPSLFAFIEMPDETKGDHYLYPDLLMYEDYLR